MSVVIRTASFPHDARSVSALVSDYLRRTEDEKAEHGLVDPRAAMPTRYTREIDDPATVFADRRVLVAAVDGVDCGVLVVGSFGGVTEISRFWMTPDARGHGVGSALLTAALRGATRPVRLSVWKWREPALRMYRTAGFGVVPSWDERPGLVCLELR
ncbi:GNAT family N-acetyltransferase [Microbacterium sp. BH-3-3-3]|uniref:GNAT family N-acetyltransferase n=1 Tax=Microbacterium sp. BH-3-3-3 TaxID=1906742 RepID=UPI00119EF25A|nr:GNAT family N-acetyltransferase [Microbacterium sp. BH-3-3-3]